MTDKELKTIQEQLAWATMWPKHTVEMLLEEINALRKEKEQLVGELLAVTNCGFCSLCRERHGVK